MPKGPQTLAKPPKARSCPSLALHPSSISPPSLPSWASGPTFYKKSSSYTGVLAEFWSKWAGGHPSFLPPSTHHPFPASFPGGQGQPGQLRGRASLNERKEAPCSVRCWALWAPGSILQMSLVPALPGLLKGPQSRWCGSAEPCTSCLPVWAALGGTCSPAPGSMPFKGPS